MKVVFLLTIALAFHVSDAFVAGQCPASQASCNGVCMTFCPGPFEETTLGDHVEDLVQNVRSTLTDWFSGWRVKRSGDIVYRVLRRTERPGEGLTAKDPSAQKTVQSHVGCGCRRNYRSQFISTTADYEAALHYGGRSRIVQIDLNLARRAGCDVIDLSNGGDLVGTARNFAIASKEVLIVGHIPAEAVTLIRPGSG